MSNVNVQILKCDLFHQFLTVFNGMRDKSLGPNFFLVTLYIQNRHRCSRRDSEKLWRWSRRRRDRSRVAEYEKHWCADTDAETEANVNRYGGQRDRETDAERSCQ